MQVLACASRTLSRFDRPSTARKFLSPKANIDVACRKTKIETFLQKHGQSINTFKETFLKRNAFACFKREGTDFVRIKCNKWFEADAWDFYEIKGIMYRRQSARARKNKKTFALRLLLLLLLRAVVDVSVRRRKPGEGHWDGNY